jgi:putative aminopeptidase
MNRAVKLQRRRSNEKSGGQAVDRRSCYLTALTAASAFLTAAFAFLTAPLSSQTVDSLALRFSAMTAITGYEQAVTDSLLQLLPGSTRDRMGNVTLVLGSGAPKRLISCAIDEVGYAVGNITDEGYLLLRRVGGGARLSPLFDQQLEGHRVTLFGRKGPVPGVVGVRSTHLARGRPAGGGAATEPLFTVDNAVVDVGAASRDEVLALGLPLLTPVSLTKRPLRYGNRLIAAPNAGRRAACAALASAALSKPRARGTVVVAFTVQGLYADSAGLKTVQNLQGPFAERRLVSVPAKFADTAVETVALGDVEALKADIVRWIGGGQ